MGIEKIVRMGSRQEKEKPKKEPHPCLLRSCCPAYYIIRMVDEIWRALGEKIHKYISSRKKLETKIYH